MLSRTRAPRFALSVFGLSLLSTGCGDNGRDVATTSAALTAEQCTASQATGKVRVCHRTASADQPFTTLWISAEACMRGHAGHEGDFIPAEGKDCAPETCVPEDGAYDGTLACCDALWPDASGRCAPATTGDGTIGSGEQVQAQPGEVLRLDGIVLTVPADSPPLSITSSQASPPARAANGAIIDARSPVYTFGPAGTTFGAPLEVSFTVGGSSDLAVFWSSGGAPYEQLDATLSDGVLSVTTSHFSSAVLGLDPCAGKLEGDACGEAPGDCAEAPTCQPAGLGLKCEGNFKGADVVCRSASGDCDVAETCDGTSAHCPEDEVAPANAVVCRAAVPGGCDVQELCDGSAKECPADSVAPVGTACRAAVDVCDVDEQCDGSNALCPEEDGFAEVGTGCDDGDAATQDDVCDGNGGCAGTCNKVNVAPLAAVSATNPWNWDRINDGIYGTCGTQDAFLWTGGVYSPPYYMTWAWASPRRISSMTVHHAQTNGRYLVAGAIEVSDNGVSWEWHADFEWAQGPCENSVSFPTVDTMWMRITDIKLGTEGQTSNPNFREIEIFGCE